jgi:ergothioneine biosynthesis protein EgtB
MTNTPQPVTTGEAHFVNTLSTRYKAVRKATEDLCTPLVTEDYGIQAMDDASPTKWHLAHVSWFFETFLLKPYLKGYQSPNPQYEFIFNSYYNAVGPQHFRPSRGHLSRPTVAEVYVYRAHVDQGMLALLRGGGHAFDTQIASRVVLGLNHEQQHQELLLTDLKYNLSVNPLRPAYHKHEIPRSGQARELGWHAYEGGIYSIGYTGKDFSFDNEGPCHDVVIQPFKLGSRLVTNGEFIEFMRDGGYERAEFWLSAGWNQMREGQWQAPLYWEGGGGAWQTFTLSGMQQVDASSPVGHVSFYEADAFARWAGKRLPTEAEWEHAALDQSDEGNFQESGHFHPLAAPESGAPVTQLFGDLWEWTGSAYLPYPGFKPGEGAIGEYNGKFMVNQMVLRGGSCATAQSHIRATYRNFFHPPDRWQFMGFRLADDK